MGSWRSRAGDDLSSVGRWCVRGLGGLGESWVGAQQGAARTARSEVRREWYRKGRREGQGREERSEPVE